MHECALNFVDNRPFFNVELVQQSIVENLSLWQVVVLHFQLKIRGVVHVKSLIECQQTCFKMRYTAGRFCLGLRMNRCGVNFTAASAVVT